MIVLSQIQIQKYSLDRNVTSAVYKLVFSDDLHTYKTTKLVYNDQKEQQ